MPKLLELVRNVMRTRHYSLRTEQTYIDWIKRYIIFNSKRHPAELGAPEVTAFLSDLAVNRKVAAATQIRPSPPSCFSIVRYSRRNCRGLKM